MYSEIGLVSHLLHAFSGADPSTESSLTLEKTLHLDLLHKGSELEETLVLGEEMTVDLKSLTSEKNLVDLRGNLSSVKNTYVEYWGLMVIKLTF